VRFCQPRPQRLEQGDHSAQLDQPPFTAGTIAIIYLVGLALGPLGPHEFIICAPLLTWSSWLCPFSAVGLGTRHQQALKRTWEVAVFSLTHRIVTKKVQRGIFLSRINLCVMGDLGLCLELDPTTGLFLQHSVVTLVVAWKYQ
jgi:hypothetical protein